MLARREMYYYCDGEAAGCSAILLIWGVLNFLVSDVNDENGMF
jgi:hypothetical protein